MDALSRLVCAVAALAFLLVACSPHAGEDEVRIVDAWTRATPPGASVGAGYMTIANGTVVPVRLLGAESEVAEKVEFHAMSMDGGVMRMRPLADGLTVPAGGKVELRPSGMHLMLIGLKRPLVEGETVTVALLFDGGVRLEAKLTVEALGGKHGP